MRWEDGQLLGEYTQRSFGERPREENESRLSQILVDYQHQKLFSNEEDFQRYLERYRLSTKACQGILRRAEMRGKELPKELKEALIRQAGNLCVSNQDHKTDTREYIGGGITPTLNTAQGGQRQPCVIQGKTFCIEGNGTRDSHRGDGYSESDVMYTLNTVERHAVAFSPDNHAPTRE